MSLVPLAVYRRAPADPILLDHFIGCVTIAPRVGAAGCPLK